MIDGIVIISDEVSTGVARHLHTLFSKSLPVMKIPFNGSRYRIRGDKEDIVFWDFEGCYIYLLDSTCPSDLPDVIDKLPPELTIPFVRDANYGDILVFGAPPVLPGNCLGIELFGAVRSLLEELCPAFTT
ncbi:MAG: hypothetical protein Athens101428_291 [Candidatus Berkelbacteria bacterium Athens1014_28]|uniref:Uncharacterized protein n=1 Tax=Candidatus Berkelbacteria bacterium Athens1014_28 TaxID=2017145 RepID=A0A554LNR8_9BACT|nr:MAG: hypothetical protein Athens101428_291 [Candidatus Berkelbacteria bacterium Athens1014_28]